MFLRMEYDCDSELSTSKKSAQDVMWLNTLVCYWSIFHKTLIQNPKECSASIAVAFLFMKMAGR